MFAGLVVGATTAAAEADSAVAVGDFVVRSDRTEPAAEATIVGYAGDDTVVALPGEVVIDGVAHTVTAVGVEAFVMRGLTRVTLPETIVRIEQGAFMGNRLTEVTIPDSVVEIADEAFFDNLLTRVTLGASVDAIGSWAFEHYDWDSDVMLPLAVTFTGPPPSTFVAARPGSLSGSFSDVDDVTVSFPAAYSAEVYPDGYSLPSWQGYETAPHVVVQFDLGAVGGGLQSVRVPAGEAYEPPPLTEPDGFAFAGWYTDAALAQPFDAADPLDADTTLYADWERFLLLEWGDIDGVMYFVDPTVPDATATAGGMSDDRTEIVIPAEVEIEGVTYTVTRIDRHAFEDSRLTSVTLPNTLLEIGEYAFASQTAVTNPKSKWRNTLGDLVIPDSVRTIGDYAFMLTGLTSVDLGSGLQHIGEAAFTDSGLTDLVLPEGLLTIGEMAFLGTGIRSVNIPGSVIEVQRYAFYDAALQQLTVAPGVQVIGEAAFNDNALTDVELPDTIARIGDSAFADNPLERVRLGGGVEEIEPEAFGYERCDCSRLSSFSSLQAPSAPQPLPDPAAGTLLIEFTGMPPLVVAAAGGHGSFGSAQNVLVRYLAAFGAAVTPGGFETDPLSGLWHGYTLQGVATVTLDLGGHGPSSAVYAIMGDPLGDAAPDPTAAGWRFEGWFVDAAYAVPFATSDPVTGDLTLFAKWSALPVDPVTPPEQLSDTGSDSVQRLLWSAALMVGLGVGMLGAARRRSVSRS